ncbi:MAG: bifunctional hydroxymethylpyrimidine kinase/phosphomethylpyrimidine kinase [Acidobacteria bacterium]|nr:bifunctional hydroxymethylpyrimidine kinase/phosphomethylpyrimidine kinase [Acidobacteriota bacterium]
MTAPAKGRLLALVGKLEGVSVTVAGDAVLDEFEFGEIARVSREAPVLILEHRWTDLAPGGAANAATNLAALGARVLLAARVGDDPQGERLARLLAERGVDVSGIERQRDYPTPTKTRILAGSPHTAKQQIVRMDRGRREIPVSGGVRERLTRSVARARRRGAAVLLADYGYGVVDPGWVARLGAGPGPVTLDSRFALQRFRGVDAATPNLEELERASGTALADDDDAGIAAAARALRRRIGAAALVVTRGSRGMTLVEARGAAARIPVFGSDEIADVTGAGDTVIATFTAARAAGGSWREAAELANIAGGLVVMKRGTATVSRDELAAAIDGRG